jgi:hypothetical protein
MQKPESDPRPGNRSAVGALNCDCARPGFFHDQTIRRPVIRLCCNRQAGSVGEKVNAITEDSLQPGNDQAELALCVTRRPNLDRLALAVTGGR